MVHQCSVLLVNLKENGMWIHVEKSSSEAQTGSRSNLNLSARTNVIDAAPRAGGALVEAGWLLVSFLEDTSAGAAANDEIVSFFEDETGTLWS